MSKPLARNAMVAAGLICAATATAAIATEASASATSTRPMTTRPATIHAAVGAPVTSPAKPPATSPVKPAALTLSIKASGPVTARTRFEETFRGIALRRSLPFGSQPVELQERAGTSARWVTVAHQRTAAKTGAVTFRVKQNRASEQYRLVLLGAGGRAAADSVVVTVKRA